MALAVRRKKGFLSFGVPATALALQLEKGKALKPAGGEEQDYTRTLALREGAAQETRKGGTEKGAEKGAHVVVWRIGCARGQQARD